MTSTYNVFPGNRLQYVSRPGSSTRRFVYDSLGRTTASWTDTDGDGVMDSNENRNEYSWTLTGLLKQARVYTNNGSTLTTVNYTYDESGTGMLRERTVVNGIATHFHWEGLSLYLEEEKSRTTWYPKRAFVNQPSGLGGTVARFDLGANNQLDTSDSGYYYYYDEAGNVILIVDKNGNVTDQFEQDCWGNDLNNTFASARNIRQHQTDKYLDETTGLYFFGARWYDPTIGRFITVSPLIPNEEEYAFCGNDPVNRFDGDGLFDESVDIIDNYQRPLREIAPDVAPSAVSPPNAKNVIIGMEEGAQCMLMLAAPGPDELTLLTKLINPVSRFLRKVPLIKNFFKGLGGNPFRGKTAEEIDKMYRNKGFIPRGKDPTNGYGDYFNPTSGRRYYIDRGNRRYRKGIVEKPHVDVFGLNVTGQPSEERMGGKGGSCPVRMNS